MIKLRTERSNGEVTEIELPRAPYAMRFCVGGANGEKSATWRLWADRNKPDVYVAARTLAGVLKVSLHASGDWRYQFTREYANQRADIIPNRTLDRWVRPIEIGSGWTKAFAVWVPSQDVTKPGARNDDPPSTHTFPQSPPGSAVTFTIVLGKPDLGIVELKGFAPLDAFELSNGEACMLLASYTRLDETAQRDLERLRQEIASQIPDGILEKVKTPRIAIFGEHDTADRYLLDLAIPVGSGGQD